MFLIRYIFVINITKNLNFYAIHSISEEKKNRKTQMVLGVFIFHSTEHNIQNMIFGKNKFVEY